MTDLISQIRIVCSNCGRGNYLPYNQERKEVSTVDVPCEFCEASLCLIMTGEKE